MGQRDTTVGRGNKNRRKGEGEKKTGQGGQSPLGQVVAMSAVVKRRKGWLRGGKRGGMTFKGALKCQERREME